MVQQIILPSGLKPSKDWNPTKEEFYKVLEFHLRMKPEEERKALIGADWKAFSKIINSEKPKVEKKKGAD